MQTDLNEGETPAALTLTSGHENWTVWASHHIYPASWQVNAKANANLSVENILCP